MNKKVAQDIFTGLLVVALVAIALPDLALAQTSINNGQVDLGNAASNIAGTELGPVAPLISALFWLGGAVMMGAGALKLKEHAENPTQTPMRQGIARMAVGAVLLTLPFFAQFAANTLGAGNNAIGYGAFVQPTANP